MFEEIRIQLIDYVFAEAVVFDGTKEEIPLDKSLIETGILDSYGIVELVAFIEETWNIRINDNDFNKEKMGSINLMSQLIMAKTKK